MTKEPLYGKTGVKDAFYAAYAEFPSILSEQELYEKYQEWLSKHNEFQSKPLTGEDVARLFGDYVNSFSDKAPEFTEAIEKLSFEHRTLQQSFTKLVLKWIEHIAKPEYRTDGRNEASQKTAQKLLKGWELLGKEDEKSTFGMPPSSWLHMI